MIVNPRGAPPSSPAWWEKARQKLNKLIPENLRKHPPEALRWFIDVRVLNNFHVFNKQEVAEMWAYGFSKLPLSERNWISLYEENIKTGEIHLLPLFGLILHYWPRAVEPASLDKCCVPGCETKRSESIPACTKHLCPLCGPLATEKDWQKRYYHICATYSQKEYGVHIISLDPKVIENLRAERERNSFYPLHFWCYGVRRECLNPMSLPGCRKDSLPTHVDNTRKMTTTEKLCSFCDTQTRCRHCSSRVDFEDAARIKDHVCNSPDCNTRLECVRCHTVRFPPTRSWNTKPIEPIDKVLCGTCQREAYFCLSCKRTSNDTKDVMWCNRLVWKPNGIKPEHCIRCLPSLKKVKGIPHGGGRWIQLRAIMLRLWWDRRAIWSQFDKDMKERPDQLFKELTHGRMDAFSTFLCHHDPENWKVLSANPAMWDSTYMLFIHLLKCPKEIFIKMLRLIC